MSSHVISEVEEVAGRVAIIRQGRLVDVDDVRTLRRRAGQAVELRFADVVEASPFAALPGVEDAVVEPDGDGTTVLRLRRGWGRPSRRHPPQKASSTQVLCPTSKSHALLDTGGAE